MIRTLSDNVILSIAGVILAFVMTLELIQFITEKNNMHDVDTWIFFKRIFKTACVVLIVTNTLNIVMGVFEVAQSVVNSASGIIISHVTNMVTYFSSAVLGLNRPSRDNGTELYCKTLLKGVDLSWQSLVNN